MAQDKQIIKTLEQKIICDCLHPRLIIEANAGAAKTTTAAMKIARLIADGLDPRKIIALSFSDPGVIAFRKAFQRVGIPPKTANAIWVGTFEEFCAVRLEEYEGFSVQRWTKPEEVRAFVLAAIPQARAWALAKYDTPLSIEGTGELVLQPHLTWALCTSSAVVAAHGSGLGRWRRQQDQASTFAALGGACHNKRIKRRRTSAAVSSTRSATDPPF